MILLTMVPLAISVSQNTVNDTQAPYFIFRGNVPDDAANALRIFSPEPPRKLSDIMCFDKLVMTATYQAMRLRLARSLELDIAPLRRILPRLLRINRRKIVIAENLWGILEGPINESFPSLELVKIPANLGIQRAVQMLAGAFILVGDHITSLIHIIWMASGRATVIDVSPKEFACNPWARNMAEKADISYVRIFDEGKCRCPTFGCYPHGAPKWTATDVLTKVREEIEKLQPTRPQIPDPNHTLSKQ
jgi:hypothetical protein